MADSQLVIWGGGHLAELLIPHFKNSSSSPFDKVVVVSRSSDQKNLHKLDLKGAHVLITRPFSHWTEERQEASTRKELDALSQAKRVIMISSTGVYLPAEDPVTENSTVNSGHPYVYAEKDLQHYSHSTVVLRAAGLYDDSRGPQHYYKRSGTVSGKPEDLINLIHYNDLAKVVQRVIEEVELSGVFNVSDNSPLSKAELHEHLISWGLEWSKIKAPQPSAETRPSKRVDSSLLWKTLQLKPLFPDFLHYTPGKS